MKIAIRNEVYKMFRGKCAYCGCDLHKGWHVDHKNPQSRSELYRMNGGNSVHDLENLFPACASCNINKHELTVEEFRNQIKGFMKHLNERSTQYKLAKRFGLVIETNNEVKFYFEL